MNLPHQLLSPGAWTVHPLKGGPARLPTSLQKRGSWAHYPRTVVQATVAEQRDGRSVVWASKQNLTRLFLSDHFFR